jgi:hypothetical protein
VVLNPDGTTRFTTTDEHDLTEARAPEDPTTITLSGIGAPWDGTHTLDNVPNRETFEIPTPAGETIPPVITSGVLIETRKAGITGIQTVATVPDADNFTFNVPAGVPSLPTGAIPNIVITTGARVTGAADYERATEIYTQQGAGNAYLFVIMSDANVSKDRHTNNDAIAAFTPQNLQKQIVLQSFTTALFIPTAANDAGAFQAQSDAYGEIFTDLLRVLYGFRFSDPTTAQNYVTVSNGHGPGVRSNNTAYYTHVYDWQIPAVITYEEGFGTGFSADVAFRDISATFENFGDEEAPLTFGLDLDEEPI